jgi:hypothetical protein
MALERAARQPCPAVRRARPVPRRERLLYNLDGVQAAYFGPGASVESEPPRHLLAIDTKMAFT